MSSPTGGLNVYIRVHLVSREIARYDAAPATTPAGSRTSRPMSMLPARATPRSTAAPDHPRLTPPSSWSTPRCHRRRSSPRAAACIRLAARRTVRGPQRRRPVPGPTARPPPRRRAERARLVCRRDGARPRSGDPPARRQQPQARPRRPPRHRPARAHLAGAGDYQPRRPRAAACPSCRRHRHASHVAVEHDRSTALRGTFSPAATRSTTSSPPTRASVGAGSTIRAACRRGADGLRAATTRSSSARAVCHRLVGDRRRRARDRARQGA